MKEAMFCDTPSFGDGPEALKAATEWAVAAGVAPTVAVAVASRSGAPEHAGSEHVSVSSRRSVGSENALVSSQRSVGSENVLVSSRRSVGSENFFDLASITKSFTAVACLRAGIPFSTQVAEIFPELADTRAAKTPLLWLLSHRAGLLDHVPLYLPAVGDPRSAASTTEPLIDRDEARITVANGFRSDLPSVDKTFGYPPIYSDLGYFLAGEMLAKYTYSRDAAAAIAKVLLHPLGLADEIGSARDLALDARLDAVVPTEVVPFRGGEIRGRVHDENAYVLEGSGGAGHAGLFGTAVALARFGQTLLSAYDSDDRFRELVRERPLGTLRAGFDGKSAEGSSAGKIAGPNTFGHLGFTGTSLWIDPDLGVATVVLTNRVSPTRASTQIRRARPILHDLLFQHGISRNGTGPR